KGFDGQTEKSSEQCTALLPNQVDATRRYRPQERSRPSHPVEQAVNYPAIWIRPHPLHYYIEAGESIFRQRTRHLMAALVVDEAGGEPPVLPEDPPSPTWWPLEETLAARGRRLPIYTFASQFTGEHEPVLFNGDGNDDQIHEALSPEQVADVDFLRGLNLQGLEASGAAIAPLRRFMVSPAAAAADGGKKTRYDKDNLPTPATLVTDLKATRNFKSAITDMNNNGSGAPLPYLGYLVFECADEVHEDDEKQYIFATSEDLAEAMAEAESEVDDPEADEGDMGAEAIADEGDMEAEAIAEEESEVDDPAADEGDMGAEAVAEAESEVDDPAADEGD
ncbi:unnamed protein product, partial [Ectocarpus sp. 4 AP-2014]